MSDTLRALQAALAGHGYSPGPIDGLWGARTRAAMAAVIDAAGRPGAASTAAQSAPALEWDARSAKALEGVHPDLARVMVQARQRSLVPFIITEGLRTPQRQAQLVKAGASQTLNSRHLTGHAVDVAALVGGKVSWDWPLYSRIAEAVKAAASDLGVPIVWGGDWKTFKDGPHYELNRKTYPA
jgi:peptidoglycan LD-endopeptidase CwlK